MTEVILSDARERMQKSVEVLKEEFSSFRTGQANPKLFQKITVSYYGSPTPLAQLAGIVALDSRTILISPYDSNALADIEEALRRAEVGNPNRDGQSLRISIPELTEDRRKELVKQVKARAEEARVSVRNLRRKAKSELEEAGYSQDEVLRAEKELETLTKGRVSQIEDLLKHKESELLKF